MITTMVNLTPNWRFQKVSEPVDESVKMTFISAGVTKYAQLVGGFVGGASPVIWGMLGTADQPDGGDGDGWPTRVVY